MTSGPAQELIRELARDLDPVRPIPRIRTAAAGVVALWLAIAALGLAALGLRPDLAEAIVATRGVAVVFAGLGLVGFGGVIAALALGVPGREAHARGAVAAAVLGMVVAAAVGTLLVATSPAPELPVPLRADLACLSVAIAVGLLPALGVIWFGGRASPHRPIILVLAAAAGAAALGAISAEMSCPHSDMRHLLVAHALAPAAGVLLLTLPLLVALKRLGRS